MNIEFRSRIGEVIDYTTILNYGLCCKGITSIGYTGEFNYYSCFATGGAYIPHTKNILYTIGFDYPTCPNPFL